MKIIEDLKAKVKENHIKEPAECKQLLIDSIKEQMSIGDTAYEFENRTSVVLVIGVTVLERQQQLENLQENFEKKERKLF